MVLVILLKYPLHKLVATMVELCAAARWYMEPVGMDCNCHNAGLPGQSGTPTEPLWLHRCG